MNRLQLPNDLLLGEVAAMLSEGRRVIIRTKGTSMLPFIVGDRDSVELEEKDRYEAGEIVLARVGDGRWVLHRLVSGDGGKVVLKGDANLSSCESCSAGDIAGSVMRIIRPGGETDCRDAGFARKSAMWRNLPDFVKRIVLGIYKRLI